MDNLSKKRRVSFSDLGEDQDDSNNTKEGRIVPQKPVSSEEERKKSNYWPQRQFSSPISNVDDASDMEFAIAVAAAAYAIASMEKESMNQNNTVEQLMQPTAKTTSKREDSIDKTPDYIRLTRWFTGKEAREDERESGNSLVKKPVTLAAKMVEESGAGHMLSGKAKETNQTIKRTPTFSDEYLNETGSSSSVHGQNQTGQQASFVIKPTSFSSKENEAKRTTNSTKLETEVDVWEREKMDKIRERFEKEISNSLEWENAKKLKAKRRLEHKEMDLKLKQSRALREYRNEISRINKTAGGKRALAEETTKNNELKMKKKAYKIH
ncbi:hypothetical protein OPV22_027055 [Ensete ventricosum]|uniref:Remorin C-terminal domain-containing protein n=1 Tax=Ensete ventricosum TaxID=4639 RepID=A0AAV8Q2R8_ENSVE|nr:hypothetical protein OPV22_027055 [Ensete ventricosum]